LETKQATEDAKTATSNAEKATNSANTATSAANKASYNANAAATAANTAEQTSVANEAIRQANEETRINNETTRQTNETARETAKADCITATTNANAATTKANTAASSASQAVKNAQDAYDLIAASSGVDKYSLIPATLNVSYQKDCVVGSTQKIDISMFPSSANKSRVLVPMNYKGEIEQDGSITSSEPTLVKLCVVSTQNSQLYQVIEINFRDVVSRTAEDGNQRTTEDGQTIEC
jgi:pyruvate/2-oxoglutarate dehydrogenase complex dihydrolipoamide acyltransferase (E2) component